ncbi:MAG: AMP-binding protein [Thermoplasmatota archaeon]
MSGDVVWRPTREATEHANVMRFMRRYGFADYAALLAASQRDVEWFWGAVEKDLKFRWYAPYTKILDETAKGPSGVAAAAPWAWSRWFVGGKTNLALNCVDRWAEGEHADKYAIVWEGEDGTIRRATYKWLALYSSGLAAGLRARGIAKGDAVGIYLPNIPEAVAAFMAIAKVGAIVVPLFSGYGADAIEKRLADADAKALITADGFLRRGARVAMKPVADEAVARVASVKTVIVVRRFEGTLDVPWTPGRDFEWMESMALGADGHTEVMDSEDPWMVIYTSGTTGRPKGAVHVHGGFLVKIAQEVAHQTDLHADDLLWWFSDMGWIMGPWMIVGTLALGGSMFLYEGAPDFPEPDRIWKLVADHKITILGVSPTLIRALEKHGDAWPAKHDLSSLRILGSTGEPWNPEPYLWLFEKIGGKRAPIINLSGGTEVGACFLSPTPLATLRACSLGGPALGMAVDVVDDAGRPVPRGTVGELVARRPWPGMTRGLWKAPDRYIETYFSRWPDLWYHGDFASIDADGEWYLHGRSDDTIKIAGKRVGPAEVESALVDTGAVSEAAAVGIPDAVKGEVVHAFCILKPGNTAGPALEARLREAVEHALGKSFRPAGIHFVADLPRTRNGKILRRGVRAKAMGKDAGDLSSLGNPEALEKIPRVR